MKVHQNRKRLSVSLDPKSTPHGAQRRARELWGYGLLSGLPFAEFVLLAGLLMTAGMFLSIEDGHSAKAHTAPHPQIYTP